MTNSFAASAIDPNIVGEIKRASRAANVDFSFMMAEAGQESSFRPDAKASTSSATGLYQFLDTTWLRAVKQWGGKYGVGELAGHITLTESGSAVVSDPAMRQQILALRDDPHYSAAFAAELARENKTEVERALGRSASPTDLYLAHFLGARGATEFVQRIAEDGDAKAADLLPQAAEANRAVFFDANGRAKTVAQIYESFAEKIEHQVSAYASASDGTVDTATATEAIALNPIDVPRTNSNSLLATMNVLALATLKMLGSKQEKGEAAAGVATNRRRTDTSA